MCGVQLNDRKTSMDLLLMLGLNETMDYVGTVRTCGREGMVIS